MAIRQEAVCEVGCLHDELLIKAGIRSLLKGHQNRDPRGPHSHPVNVIHYDEATFGQRVADRVAAVIGSWPFLIIQTLIVAVWVALNIVAFAYRWDPYPFILLNLMFSVQAAYAGPVILLASNRQTEKDRLTLEHADKEADETGERTLTILDEIRKNTEVTVRILQHLETAQEAILKARDSD